MYGQAPQMSQQQAPSQGTNASHNPFAAAGGFGGHSFGNAGVQHFSQPLSLLTKVEHTYSEVVACFASVDVGAAVHCTTPHQQI